MVVFASPVECHIAVHPATCVVVTHIIVLVSLLNIENLMHPVHMFFPATLTFPHAPRALDEAATHQVGAVRKEQQALQIVAPHSHTVQLLERRWLFAADRIGDSSRARRGKYAGS